ncbi:MAG: response regulator [Chloroflexota bacterium]|nr:response regulator [Chloroflexota bacterium]
MPDAPALPTALPLLIVDDEPEILDLLHTILEEEGFRVLAARNGAAALDLVQRTPVSLVLTDLMMPQLSGLELAQRLRSEPQTAAIPLVLMSAALPPQVGDVFTAVIQKPFVIDALLRIVRELLPT